MIEQRSPGRVHDVELFAEALALVGKSDVGPEDLVMRLRPFARKLERRSAGMGFIASTPGKGRELAKGTAREVLRELRVLGLIEPAAGQTIRLTSQGADLSRKFASRRSSKEGFRMLAALHLSAYPGLRNLLRALEEHRLGAMLIPRPSPREMGSTIASRSIDAYLPYIEASSAYVADQLRQWGVPGVRWTSVAAAVDKAAAARDASYRRAAKQWTHKIMSDTIQDALTRFALGRLVPGVGVVDFEIYCSRGSSLGLLNYTDRMADAYGRIVYATSWSSPALGPAEIRLSDLAAVQYETNSGVRQQFLHAPKWVGISKRFTSELLRAYRHLNALHRTLYVLVADMRDIVCFRLRITDADFDRLLEILYHRSMRSTTLLKVSLEADEIKETRGTQTTKRNPLYLAGKAPRTMIQIGEGR